MAISKMKLRVGVSDDPTALQPSLNDCLAAMLQQAEPLFAAVLQGLEVGATAAGARRVHAFQAPSVTSFVRALQAALMEHVPDAQVREVLIVPAAGLLGVSLRKLYRELADWLRSTGV